ncbi:hypothetical protein BECAL_02440 [Bellilinea caldifistulae]|uniref:Uncharacterized protein n=1 Tax=Bellilinea caldifistulae TaxID=360411 RepID=A0A0P6XXG0_9CHLR|nr:hypothetical protein [Bellilinea caldifistulae]KPL73950.1 hypothetical protein AC812_14375 [Bellilinea caldifistulae]GAP11254.1 hypothetical protein BECAL_02440 [Bellilinea caldifistulae]
MRKPFLVLSILAFLTCLVAGIAIAQKSLGSVNPQEPVQEIARPASAHQQNILLIHVDQLEKNQPDVISVWGLILYFPEPKIILQSIYPSPIGRENFPLATFKLTKTKNLNPPFIQQVSLQTQMAWDNYILIDHQGLSFFAAGLTANEVFSPENQTNGVIPVESAYLARLCDRFVEMEQTAFQQIEWSHIIPEHWRSNLPFDQAILHWEKLTSPQSPIKCEVFGE